MPSKSPEPVTVKLNVTTHAACRGDRRIADYVVSCVRDRTGGELSVEANQDPADPNVWLFRGQRAAIEFVRDAVRTLDREDPLGLMRPGVDSLLHVEEVRLAA